MRLLLVHGRSQGGKDPVSLKAEWLGALNKGLQKSGLSLPENIEIDFPFYGDQLDLRPLSANKFVGANECQSKQLQSQTCGDVAIITANGRQ